jgi:hypothetical protein
MAKPNIMDLISGSEGPGDDDEQTDDEDTEDALPKQDPEALIAGIEAQLAELRRAI